MYSSGLLRVVWLLMMVNVASATWQNQNLLPPSRKWITELFSDAQRDFSMGEAPNAHCRSDYRLYLSHLRNLSVWAVRSLLRIVWLLMMVNVASATWQNQNLLPSSRKWITELFSDAQRDFSMGEAPNAHCRSDYRLYLSHLRNMSVWAVRMKESSEWPSVGLYSGIIDHLGNWAECMRASGPNGIKGQYCLAEMTIKNFPTNHYDSARHLSTVGCDCEECSAWSMLRKCSDEPLRAERRKITWAMCLPSSCSSEDLQKSLESIVTPIFSRNNITVELSMDSSKCSTSAEVPEEYPREYYLTRSIFSILIILVLAATINDVYIMKKSVEPKGWFGPVLASFSARKSFQSLTETTEETRNPIFFMKFIFTVCVVVAHRWLLTFMFPIFQAEEMEMDYYSGKLFFLSQMNGVDVFFLTSGLLFYKFSVKPMRKIGFPFVGIYMIFRMLKTLPVHGMLILFVSNMFPYLGDGPLWKSSLIWMSQPCHSHWLGNLLNINDLSQPDQRCIIPTWHLAVDFQNCLIGICLLLISTKSHRFGMALIGLAFIFSTLLTGLMTYFFKLNGFHVLGIGALRNSLNDMDFNKLYFSFYPRLSPFILGMLVSFIIEKMKEKNYKIPRTLSVFLVLLSVAVAVVVQYHGFTLVCDTRYSTLWKAVFAGLYRPLYVLPFGIILMIYFTTGVGFLDYLFTRKIFFALGRLSLPYVLCSFVFQMYHVATQRNHTPTSSAMNIYMWAIADLIISLPITLFFYLIVDGPFSNLTKLLKIALLKTAFARQCVEKSSEKKIE